MSAQVLSDVNYVMKSSKKQLVGDSNNIGTLSHSSSISTLMSSNVTANTPGIVNYSSMINGYNDIAVDDAPSLTSSLLSRKRHMAPDDKLARCRERNRMHARKTRERKKNQMNALQQRIEDLHAESKELRLKIDERYTARLLIGLTSKCADMEDCVSSGMLCSDSYSNTADWFRDETAIPYQKRVRSPGKHGQLERERFRRERNRMHAKRTRDRKKLFFEISETVISKMEAEVKVLRDYLVSVNMMSTEEAKARTDRDRTARLSLAMLKNGGDIDSANFAATIASGSSVDEDDEDEDENPEVVCDEPNLLAGHHHIVDRVVVEDNEDDLDGDDDTSNNGSSYGSGSQDGSSGGTTSHESGGSSSSVTQTTTSSENGIEGDGRLGDDDSENNDIIDADASFQVKDINSANFVNKSTLDALNTSQILKSFTG